MAQDAAALLAKWKGRKEAALRDQRRCHRQWQINQYFAAGLQWLRRETRTGRVLPVFNSRDGRPYQTADVLDQYVRTAIGKLAGGDFRPQLFALHDDAMSEEYAEELNDAWGWGWENEWHGDDKALAMLRTLAVLGTGGIRVRYDRSRGPLLAKEVPHDPLGRPILDGQQGRNYVAQRQSQGLSAGLRPLREGQVVWELLSPWNLLPEPGIEDPADFTWEIVSRPVELAVVKGVYGAKADNLEAEPIENAGMFGVGAPTSGSEQLPAPPTVGRLENHVMLHTGYLRPCPDYPDGQTYVFTDQGALAVEQTLPFTDQPAGPRSGITYFRWSIVPGRFWGKSFMEPGVGPQITRNKRLTQIDAIIDHGLPKTYYQESSLDPEEIQGHPGEWVPVKAGMQMPVDSSGIQPGAWMDANVDRQAANVEMALGLHDVSLGKASSASAPYARLALESENDVVKLGPISAQFKQGLAQAGRDTFEAMRQWPSQKRMLLAGEGDDAKLRVLVFETSKLPTTYLVREAPGQPISRSQGAELQKIADLWQAALNCLAVQKDTDAWMDWYYRSLEAGEALELPAQSIRLQQAHKAALENIVMERIGQPLPVQPYDDAQVHVQVHEQAEMSLDERIGLGDQEAAVARQAIEQHRLEHLQMAEATAGIAGGMPQGPPGLPPQGPPGAPPAPNGAPPQLAAAGQPPGV